MSLLLAGLLAASALADGASASNPVAMKQVPAVAATQQSTSLLTRQIGRVLIRVTGQATSADIANARVVEWQYEHWSVLVQGTSGDDVSDVKATAANWLDTDDETQVMQRRLQRVGIPLTRLATARPHWQTDQSARRTASASEAA